MDPVGRSLAAYFRRPDAEPARRIATYDHMRQHYVAFSRAERLLALTAGGPVHRRFDDIWDGARRWSELCPGDLGGAGPPAVRAQGECPCRRGRAGVGAAEAASDGRGRASGSSALRRASL